MRSLVTSQTALAARRSLAPVLLVTLTTYSDREALTVASTYRFSDRGVLYDYGNTGTVRTFSPYVAGIEPLRRSMAHIPQPEPSGTGGPLVASLTLSLANTTWTDGTSRLWAVLGAENLLRARVEVATVLVDLARGESLYDLRALTGDEHVVWFRGALARVEGVDDSAIQLRFETELPQIPWITATDDSTVDPIDRGTRLPIVYGSMPRVPCVSWQVGWTTTLAQVLGAGVTGQVSVTDASGFPASGLFEVRIAGERVTCNGSSPTANTINVTVRGVGGTATGEYAAGVVVLEVITEVIVVPAGHETSNVSRLYCRNPYNDELFAITTGYVVDTADTTLVAGETVTTVRLAAAQLSELLAAAFTSSEVTAQPSLMPSGSQTTDTVYAPDVRTTETSVAGSYSKLTLNSSASAPRLTLSNPGTSNGHRLTFSGALNLPTVDVLGLRVFVTFNWAAASAQHGHTITAKCYGFPGLADGHTFSVLPTSASGSVVLEYPGAGEFYTPPPGTQVHDLLGAYIVFYLANQPNQGQSSNGDYFELADGGFGVAVRTRTVPADDITDVKIKGASVGFGLRFFADVDGAVAPAAVSHEATTALGSALPMDDVDADEWRAGSFTSSYGGAAETIEVRARKLGAWTADVGVSLRADAATQPGAASGTFANISAASIPNTEAFATVASAASSAPTVAAGTRYHVALTGGNQPSPEAVVYDAEDAAVNWVGVNATLLQTSGDTLKHTCNTDAANWASPHSSTLGNATIDTVPCLSITTASGQSHGSAQRSASFAAEDWTGKRIRVSVQFTASARLHVTDLSVYLSSDSFASNSLRIPIDLSQFPVSYLTQTWVTVDINPERWTAVTGGFNITAVTNLRIDATYDAAFGGRVFYVANVYRYAERSVGSGAIRALGTSAANAAGGFGVLRTDVGAVDWTGKVVKVRAWWERGGLRSEAEWYNYAAGRVVALTLGDTAADPATNFKRYLPFHSVSHPAGGWVDLYYDLSRTSGATYYAGGTGCNLATVRALKLIAVGNTQDRTLYVDDIRVCPPFVEFEYAAGAEYTARASDAAGSPGAWTSTGSTQLWLRVAGSNPYVAATGEVLSHPSDMLRHLLTEVCGEPTAVVDDATFDATVVSTGGEHAALIGGLGYDFDEIASRLAYETRANLVSDESVSTRAYYLHAAGASPTWAFGASVRTLTDFSSFAEVGRDVREIATRHSALYALDVSADSYDESAFLGIARCDEVENDTAVVGTDITDAMARFGRRDAAPLALRTVQDTATARERLGYFAREGLRDGARLFLLTCPWWEAYDLQLGDIVTVTPPWSASSVKCRLIEYEKDWNTEAVSLRVVEVP